MNLGKMVEVKFYGVINYMLRIFILFCWGCGSNDRILYRKV